MEGLEVGGAKAHVIKVDKSQLVKGRNIIYNGKFLNSICHIIVAARLLLTSVTKVFVILLAIL